ncbi:hypothetical protein A9Q84_00695 [Halobacteriovorax marinus]|uniref:YaeQ family protein n=1 Tax=Halobacteriovorax marinus TaxID=97084 RepID=A0A1Y5FBJ9_9BACT|nr:hypothetical protein A9Q84_00695 [Halobacteriovorax marinus]
MALGATIFKVNLNISNFNTHYYQDDNLTLAMHPSENEARMMYRLLAYIYCAHEDLEFSKGLSNTEEPELWQKALTGDIIHWIELGLPDEKRIRQAAGKSQKVSIFTYHQKKAQDWLPKIKAKFDNNEKVNIFHLEVVENGPIDKFVTKSMNLSCTIEDNLMYLGNDDERIGIEVTKSC